MTYESATNRASAGMVAGCSRRFVLGRARRPGTKGYRYHSTHAGNFNQDLSGRCQLGFYQCGSDFGAKGRTNSHQFSLRFQLGRDQRTTPGRRRQPKFLAVATLRISRGHQYRRLLLADRSKPVSARRGLPTLALLAQLETAFDDKRGKELAVSGMLVIAWLPQLLL
jgi:hypothetical protein